MLLGQHAIRQAPLNAPPPPPHDCNLPLGEVCSRVPLLRPCENAGLLIPDRLSNGCTPLNKLRPERAAPTGWGRCGLRAGRPPCSLGVSTGLMLLGQHAIRKAPLDAPPPHCAVASCGTPQWPPCGGHYSNSGHRGRSMDGINASLWQYTAPPCEVAGEPTIESWRLHDV